MKIRYTDFRVLQGIMLCAKQEERVKDPRYRRSAVRRLNMGEEPQMRVFTVTTILFSQIVFRSY